MINEVGTIDRRMLNFRGVRSWMRIVFPKNMTRMNIPLNVKAPLAMEDTLNVKKYETIHTQERCLNEEKRQLYEKIIKDNNNNNHNNFTINNNNQNNNNQNNITRRSNNIMKNRVNNDKRCPDRLKSSYAGRCPHKNKHRNSNNVNNKHRNPNSSDFNCHKKRGRNIRRNDFFKKCYTNNNACHADCSSHQPICRRHSVVMNFSTTPCCDCVHYCYRPSLPPPPTYDSIQINDHYLNASCDHCISNCDLYAGQESYPYMYETQGGYFIPKYHPPCCSPSQSGEVSQEEREEEEEKEEEEDEEEDFPISSLLRHELMKMSEQQNLILEQQKCLQDQLIRQNEILESQGLFLSIVHPDTGEVVTSFNNGNNQTEKKGAKTITLCRPPTGVLGEIKKPTILTSSQLRGRFAECRMWSWCQAFHYALQLYIKNYYLQSCNE